MTLPWIAACAAAGLIAGPRLRGSLFSRSAGLAAGLALAAMDPLVARHQVTHLGMPDFRPGVGRSSGAVGGP